MGLGRGIHAADTAPTPPASTDFRDLLDPLLPTVGRHGSVQLTIDI
jgi:hypothetical protein